MVDSESRDSKEKSKPESGVPPRPVVIYTCVTTVLAILGFCALILWHPNQQSEDTNIPSSNTNVALFTIALMFSGGVIGGSLYSFRGLVKHSSKADYKKSHNLSYYLRPFSSGISGVMFFFLLLAGAITLTIGGNQASPGWGYYPGVLPYLAFALLAGYGSHEFKNKLNDLADSLFASKKSKDEEDDTDE